MRWAPQPGPQLDAIHASWCEELLYGGAAGGGKTDFLLGDYLQDVGEFAAAWQGIMFRRSMPELEEMIGRAMEVFPGTGAAWKEGRKRWEWSNGAKLRMRFLENDRDATRYQGGAYTWIGWDELGQHPTPFGYKYLRGRLRSAHPVARKRIRGTANPGGVGHHWLKAKFVTPAPLGGVLLKDPDTQGDIMFIRSKLSDNKILMANDPGYRDRLKGMGSEALVRAWMDGDWDIIAGAFFPEFSTEKHVVKARALPEEWTRFRSADWGSAKPFSVGWWAISDGSLPEFPRGALIRYREWYGIKTTPGGSFEPNVGLKLTAEEVGAGILEREVGEKVSGGFLDPSAFAHNGGPSIAERIFEGGKRKVPFHAADNSRVAKHGAQGGWDQVRARLKGDADGRPMIYFFENCVHAIRTLPALQHDQMRAEDVDTEGEDHAPDEIRYACMSRPFVPLKASNEPPKFWHQQTIDELWKDTRRGVGRI